MSAFGERFKQEMKGFIPEFQQQLRNEREGEIMEAVYSERCSNIETAAVAMLDAGLSYSVVAGVLQKHWDLRLSEATEYLGRAQLRLEIGEEQ